MTFPLAHLDAVLEHESLYASITDARVLELGAVLEVDLALSWGWVERGEEGDGMHAGNVGLRCRGVKAWSLEGGWVGSVRIVENDPALVPFEDSRSRLSYQGEPRDPEGVVAALHLAHSRTVGNAVPMFLASGSSFAAGWSTGTVAEGPTSLMETYARVLRQHNITAVLSPVAAFPGDGRQPASDLKVCAIGDGRVVATDFQTYGELPAVRLDLHDRSAPS